jgi:glycosyltransferase involved in cell wall biosynthesis
MSALPPRPSLCFVAHFAYPALAERATGHIGGVERQTALMSRWFAARGYDVSVVTWDEGQPDDLEIAGVRVLKLCGRNEGVPGIRFLSPRWTSLVRALRRANADIYYQNCGEYVTGQVGLWCRWHGRRFVYSVACDADCDPRLPEMTLRERVLYRCGVRRADRVIVQTRTQARMLRDGFGRQAQVIPMPGTDMASESPSSAGRVALPRRILWLGRIARVKRPDRLLDLAARCPEFELDLVGPEDGTSYARQVVERARALPNLSVHGQATAAQIREFLGRAMCLVSTSEYEGFPNTFLESWSAGVPVISTVDPDGVIVRYGLGGIGADTAELARAIGELAACPQRWMETSSRARRYFVEHHSVDRVLPEFERVFVDVAGRPARPRVLALAGRETR